MVRIHLCHSESRGEDPPVGGTFSTPEGYESATPSRFNRRCYCEEGEPGDVPGRLCGRCSPTLCSASEVTE